MRNAHRKILFSIISEASQSPSVKKCGLKDLILDKEIGEMSILGSLIKALYL